MNDIDNPLSQNLRQTNSIPNYTLITHFIRTGAKNSLGYVIGHIKFKILYIIWILNKFLQSRNLIRSEKERQHSTDKIFFIKLKNFN